MVLAGQEFEDTVEQGRVLPDIRVLRRYVLAYAGVVGELDVAEMREVDRKSVV